MLNTSSLTSTARPSQSGQRLVASRRAPPQGMKSSIHDFAKLDGRIVEVGGLRGYDLRFAGIAKGGKVVGSQRLLLRGSQLVMVTIVARDDSMPDIEQSAVELLAGVTLTPLSPPQAPATAAAPAPPPPALPPQAPTAAAAPPRLPLPPPP